MALVKKALIYTLRPKTGLDARTCHPRYRTIDSTKNHLKEKGKYNLILNIAR